MLNLLWELGVVALFGVLGEFSIDRSDRSDPGVLGVLGVLGELRGDGIFTGEGDGTLLGLLSCVRLGDEVKRDFPDVFKLLLEEQFSNAVCLN